MSRVFVTGTDTGVGKTMVAAWLARSWGAAYWKPIQTGAATDRDADTVAALAPGVTILPECYEFTAPLSPHEAARREGATIDLARIVPPAAEALVVEGAGGVLVPLNDRFLMVDLIRALGLPALVVARTSLGTINHTLMTLEVLARRDIPIAGVITSGAPDAANRAAIERYSGVPVVAELPRLTSPAALTTVPSTGWRP